MMTVYGKSLCGSPRGRTQGSGPRMQVMRGTKIMWDQVQFQAVDDGPGPPGAVKRP